MHRLLYKYFLSFCILFGLIGLPLSAQSTFQEVMTVFDNNGCSSTYCHGGGAGGLTLNEDLNETYANLLGISPENLTALEKGDELVMAGYPERSFLYRKINDHLYADSEMDPTTEGDAMPPSGDALSNRDKEMIRQWIFYGAPKQGQAFTDNVKQAFTDYHNDGGIGPIEAPEPPAEGEGFQIHFGSIFLQPGDEVEYTKKYDLRLAEDLEVNRLELIMNDFSHHFLLYKYEEELAATIPDGIRPETNITDNPLLNPQSELVSSWQDNADFRLPEGTAFKWNPGTVLDLNFHILNYDQVAPLSADLYVNVYTQPAGTAVKEMVSEVVPGAIGGFGGGGELLALLPGVIDTFSDDYDWNQTINLWNITPHTHKYGTDYDVYYQFPDGSELQILEGHYNTDYTVFTGVYDYSHPPLRFFDNLLEITPETGIRQEAAYNNTGGDFVTWGLTTNSEMMLSLIQYTIGENHQEDMILNEINDTYCLDDAPVELIANFDSGVVGNGVTHNIFDPNVAGLGSHVLYVNCCDPSTMSEIIIEVVPSLEGELSINNNTTGLGNADLSSEWTGSEEITYQWLFDGEIIEGATTADYEAEFNGDYTLEISNGACKTVSTFTVTEATNTSIESVNIIGFNAAPNPFSEQTRITFSLSENSEVVAEIYDISGKQVALLTDATLATGEHTFKFNGEEAGIYFLNLQIDGKTYTHKLIKQ